MRYLLPVALLTVVSLGGCDNERQTYSVVPDRQGHATGPEGQAQNISGKTVAGPGERYYTVEQGDTLTSIARKFNVDIGWLIKRNDIQHRDEVKPGSTQLIVPQSAVAPVPPAPAPAPQAPGATYP